MITDNPKGSFQPLLSEAPPSDGFGMIYRRYLQGAWVRSGASVVMWFFAVLTYYLKSISFYSFVGISFTILYLILINLPTLWILKRIRQKNRIEAFSLVIHGLEVIGHTAIVYFSGSMSRGYLTLLFAALITYVGVMSPRYWPFIVTCFCSLLDQIPPTLWADERKLKQILYKLLSNAVKFTPEGGSGQLEARGLSGPGVEITVRDNGVGLKETDLERIFRPFEQGDNSAGRKYQGTGLGLSLTKRMVELHGGRIWAESAGPAKGSRFLVFLPGEIKEGD